MLARFSPKSWFDANAEMGQIFLLLLGMGISLANAQLGGAQAPIEANGVVTGLVAIIPLLQAFRPQDKIREKWHSFVLTFGAMPVFGTFGGEAIATYVDKSETFSLISIPFLLSMCIAILMYLAYFGLGSMSRLTQGDWVASFGNFTPNTQAMYLALVTNRQTIPGDRFFVMLSTYRHLDTLWGTDHDRVQELDFAGDIDAVLEGSLFVQLKRMLVEDNPTARYEAMFDGAYRELENWETRFEQDHGRKRRRVTRPRSIVSRR
jgi:hypothetical protein